MSTSTVSSSATVAISDGVFRALVAQKAMTAAKVACAQDLAGDPLQQLVSGVQQRGFTTAETQAIVFAMQKQNNSDAYEPLC